jgi:hypothetical protein
MNNKDKLQCLLKTAAFCDFCFSVAFKEFYFALCSNDWFINEVMVFKIMSRNTSGIYFFISCI